MSTTELKSGDFVVSTSTFGAEITSIKFAGVDYLWEGNPNFWSGQAPILFPIVGSIPTQGLKSKQGPVVLPRHGLARKTEHKLIVQTNKKVTYELRSNDQTKCKYPYDFALNISYELTGEKSVTQAFNVSNPGTCQLPYVVGGHPAFNVPLKSSPNEGFNDYELRFAQRWSYEAPNLDLTTGILDFQNTWTALTDTDRLALSHEMFDKRDTLVLQNVPNNTVQLVSKVSGHGVQLDFEGFPYLGVWSAHNEAPFVAVEPWLGCASALDEGPNFEEKRGIQILEPGETRTHSFTITII